MNISIQILHIFCNLLGAFIKSTFNWCSTFSHLKLRKWFFADALFTRLVIEGRLFSEKLSDFISRNLCKIWTHLFAWSFSFFDRFKSCFLGVLVEIDIFSCLETQWWVFCHHFRWPTAAVSWTQRDNFVTSKSLKFRDICHFPTEEYIHGDFGFQGGEQDAV